MPVVVPARAAAAALIAICAFFPSVVRADVLRVDARATGGANNGSSWRDAFTDLQDALGVAQAGDEIWVAGGVYTPDRGTGDRSLSFELKNGVALYGGFAGSETRRDQSDPVLHETVLSGDLLGDDGPRDCAEHSDCCYEHEEAGCDNAACEALICAANPRCCDDSIPLPYYEVNRWHGECVYAASLECCDIGNWRVCDNSYHVVTAENVDRSATLEGFTLEKSYEGNLRDDADTVPAGLFCASGDPTVTNNILRRNVGAGIFADRESEPTLTRCAFEHNVGYGMWSQADTTVARECRFIGNSGSALSIRGGTVVDCLFAGNRSRGIFAERDTVVTRCTFLDTTWSAITLYGGSSSITDCLFSGNGGAINVSWAAAKISRCAIIGNGVEGGRSTAINIAGSVTLRDSLLIGNVGEWGAAISHSNGLLRIFNSTIAHNFSGNFRGGLSLHHGARAELTNTILWGNTARLGTIEEQQIGLDSDGTAVTFNHSIVQGWTGIHGGVGNSGTDPLFVDADGWDKIPGTEDDDLRLTADSPGIDAGDPGFAPVTGETDYAGHPRVLCGRVDMGAYEFGMGDFDCDTAIDLTDFAAWDNCMTGPDNGPFPAGCEAFDFNADTDVDMTDYTAILRVLSGP